MLVNLKKKKTSRKTTTRFEPLFSVSRSISMTRRSCALYAVGIACAHLLVIGIGLMLSHVFRNIIHNRLKGVSSLWPAKINNRSTVYTSNPDA